MAQFTPLPPITVTPEAPSDEVPLGTTEGPTQEGIALGAPVSDTSPLPDPVINSRAIKFQEGVGKFLQSDTNTIRNDIASGKEANLRYVASTAIDIDKQKQKMQMLSQLAVTKGAPLDENELRAILDPFNP